MDYDMISKGIDLCHAVDANWPFAEGLEGMLQHICNDTFVADYMAATDTEGDGLSDTVHCTHPTLLLEESAYLATSAAVIRRTLADAADTIDCRTPAERALWAIATARVRMRPIAVAAAHLDYELCLERWCHIRQELN